MKWPNKRHAFLKKVNQAPFCCEASPGWIGKNTPHKCGFSVQREWKFKTCQEMSVFVVCFSPAQVLCSPVWFVFIHFSFPVSQKQVHTPNLKSDVFEWMTHKTLPSYIIFPWIPPFSTSTQVGFEACKSLHCTCQPN